MNVTFCCSEGNDLYKVLAGMGIERPRYEDVRVAVEEAAPNSGLVLLADQYPKAEWELDQKLLDQIAAKKLRVYAEFPKEVHGLDMGEARPTQWERVFVTSSEFFAGESGVKDNQILAVHGCWFMPVFAEEADQADSQGRFEDSAARMARRQLSPYLSVARVAGYDHTVFEWPEEMYPILFQLPGSEVLISTTKLSQFVTGRYGPREAWSGIWRRILAWLVPDSEVPALEWTPHVTVQYGKDEPLLPKAALTAVGSASDAEAPEAGVSASEAVAKSGAESIEVPKAGTGTVAAADAGAAGAGETSKELLAQAEEAARQLSYEWFRDHTLFANRGKVSAIEGYVSQIDHRGNQLQNAYMHRADCITESAKVFAVEWALNRNPVSKQTAIDMMNSVWQDEKTFLQTDPDSPVYGLVNWYDQAQIFYGDDNARVLLASLFTARLLEDDRWDEVMLRCILANYRTSGKYGFRRANLVYPLHFQEGRSWEHYREEEFVHLAPHFQCYLWACYLWAYEMTGYEPLLETSKTAIRMTMEAYPDQWKWTNGLSQEIARMMLPLSYLVRVEDTAEHRGWLKQISEDLLELMQPCGAIAEKLGIIENGRYPAPQSNERYGTTEASLIQNNGDPASDLLYTVNFAYLGLHEAAAVTGDPALKEAEDRLTEFLVRIQVRSREHPYLDGAWMRSFDFDKWEYWGSSADQGWGAWCIQTGWTNSWINAILYMRRTGETLFDLSRSESFKALCPRLVREMLG